MSEVNTKDLRSKKVNIVIGLFFLWVILALGAGFRVPGFDRDSLTYIDIINRPLQDIWFQEPSFLLLIVINKNIFGGGYQTFFLMYALLGIGIKLYAIGKLNSGKIFACIVYFLLYYALHDLTQIRVGVASGLFLLSLFYIPKRKKLALLLQIMAALFHYSAIVGFVTLFFSSKKINTWFWLIAVLFSVMISKLITQSLVLNAAVYLPPFLSIKINNYMNLLNTQGIFMNFNQYNFYYLGCVALFMLGLFITYRRAPCGYNNYPVFLVVIKALGLMIISYYLLAPIPIFAGRISEFYGIVLIFYLPLLSVFIRPRILVLMAFFAFILVHALRLNLEILNF